MLYNAVHKPYFYWFEPVFSSKTFNFVFLFKEAICIGHTDTVMYMGTKNFTNKQRKYTPFLKGIYFERYVIRKLYEMGYIAIRAPGSGSGKDRPEPDILVIKNGKVVGLELNYRSKVDNIKVLVQKVRKLYEFVERAKIPLYLCVKYKGHPILCIDYNYLFKELAFNPKRYVVVTKDKILREGKELFNLLKEIIS